MIEYNEPNSIFLKFHSSCAVLNETKEREILSGIHSAYCKVKNSFSASAEGQSLSSFQTLKPCNRLKKACCKCLFMGQ